MVGLAMAQVMQKKSNILGGIKRQCWGLYKGWKFFSIEG
jgi:hypothetical protein